MNRINYRYIIINFFVFVIFQLFILYKIVLFNYGFVFIHVGFLLFLPFGLNPLLRLSIGFIIGLILDHFSGSYGLHAFASTLIVYLKDYWLVRVTETPEEDYNISVLNLKPLSSFFYLFILLFLYFLLIFHIEHGGNSGFFIVQFRVWLTTIFSFLFIYVINLLLADNPRKRI